MKKLIVPLILSLILSLSISVSASAQVDLSSMSYDDLVALSKDVGRVIMQHDDFDSVSVPRGIWEVGSDIPAGTWILTSSDGGYVNITYGTTLEPGGNSMNQFERGNTSQDLEDSESWRVVAKDGCYFEIRYGDVTFTSDTGSTGLGFKKK